MGLLRRAFVVALLGAGAAGACAVPTFGGFGSPATDGGLPDTTLGFDTMPPNPPDDAGDTTIQDSTTIDTAPPPPPADSGTKDTGVGADACPSTRGPTGASAGGAYCIDSTEVTNGQYKQFLAATGGDAGAAPSVCVWNTSYTPAGVWPRASGTDSLPVEQVNWCDAFMFCKWAGKRLCGLKSGGPTPLAQIASVNDQWFSACSADGMFMYPYAAAYEPNACNGVDSDAGRPDPVGSKTGCVGGYPGIFDMSGNVAEWEDACEAGAPPDGGGSPNGSTDICAARGGGFGSNSSELACAAKSGVPRSHTLDAVGFRCCWP